MPGYLLNYTHNKIYMYGLIGRPLGHSFSADFFNTKFKKDNIDEVYNLFPLPDINSLPTLLDEHPDLKGLNVTIPYKQQVIPFLDSLSPEASEIGAVNVIKIIHRDGRRLLHGFNSDAIGFRNSIAPLLRPEMKKALVLGTGGASKAVVYVLKALGLDVTMVSRSRHAGAISYADVPPEIISDHLVIVNTTPLGMWPNTDEAPDIPYSLLTPDHLLFDLVYNPEVTAFMAKGREKGATVKNGLEMLHGQALAAWDIWNS